MKWGTERNTWSTVLAVSAVEAGMVSEEPPRYSKHPITVMKGPSEIREAQRECVCRKAESVSTGLNHKLIIDFRVMDVRKREQL